MEHLWEIAERDLDSGSGSAKDGRNSERDEPGSVAEALRGELDDDLDAEDEDEEEDREWKASDDDYRDDELEGIGPSLKRHCSSGGLRGNRDHRESSLQLSSVGEMDSSDSEDEQDEDEQEVIEILSDEEGRRPWLGRGAGAGAAAAAAGATAFRPGRAPEQQQQLLDRAAVLRFHSIHESNEAAASDGLSDLATSAPFASAASSGCDSLPSVSQAQNGLNGVGEEVNSRQCPSWLERESRGRTRACPWVSGDGRSSAAPNGLDGSNSSGSGNGRVSNMGHRRLRKRSVRESSEESSDDEVEGKASSELSSGRTSKAKGGWLVRMESRVSGMPASSTRDPQDQQQQPPLEGQQERKKDGSAASSASKQPATSDSSAAPLPEFPLNLECPMCLNPLAVVALFACGHGACWECSHDWCQRGTSATMDCPTCHVSIPRKDFRRCLMLDEVVEEAVARHGLDGAEWQQRLAKGQALARQAEATRRNARDAQRSAENTIAEQAAELERLREEVKARAHASGRRGAQDYQAFAPAPADFGIRLFNRDVYMRTPGGPVREDVLRVRRQRYAGSSVGGEPLALSRGSGSATPATASSASFSSGAQDAAAAGASAPGRPVPAYALGRWRGQPPSADSTHGFSREHPWFSLRPQSGRQGAAGAMAGTRLTRDGFGAPTRSSPHTDIGMAGIDLSTGASLKGAHQDRRFAMNTRMGLIRGSGPTATATSAGEHGARHGSSLSSLHAFVGAPAASSRTLAGSDHVGSGVDGHARATHAAGRRAGVPAAIPSTRRKRQGARYPPRPSHAHAPLASGFPAAAAPAGGMPPGSASASVPYSAGAVTATPASSSAGARAAGSSNLSRAIPSADNRFGMRLPGSAGAAAAGGGPSGGAGARLEEADSDFEALDFIARHDDFGTRPSEWAEALATVFPPQHEADGPSHGSRE